MPEEEKMNIYNRALSNLSSLNTELIASSISKIVLPNGAELDDREVILDFINNTGVKLVKKITGKMEALKQLNEIKPLQLTCNNEECRHEYESPIIFDYSRFFG